MVNCFSWTQNPEFRNTKNIHPKFIPLFEKQCSSGSTLFFKKWFEILKKKIVHSVLIKLNIVNYLPLKLHTL